MIKNIRIEELTFGYKKQLVLKDINYDFKINEITVILGLNGSGKTTLLKIICNLLNKYNGNIIIDNKNIKDLKPNEISKYISFVSQLALENNDFKVIDFLTFGLVNKIKFYDQPKEDHIRKIKEIVNKLGLSNLLEKNMNELSGGEQQMIYICSAIVQDTPIIILDEPVSALDMNNQYKILTLLKKLKQNGKTIILTAHNPNICLYLNANVLIINDHQIYMSGLAKEIINVNNLKEVYGDNLILSKEIEYDEITFK